MAGHWTPVLAWGLTGGIVRCLPKAISPFHENRILVLKLVSCHSALKEGRALQVKIGLCHHENCIIFYQWFSERGGGSGQCETKFWPRRSKGNRPGWWVLENFFLSGKKRFLLPSILLYEDMSGALAAILQSSWLKDKARMLGPAKGTDGKLRFSTALLFCWVDSPETTCLRAAVIWDNKHLLFKPLLVRSSSTCRGKHLNWYRTLSIPWTKSAQKGSKETDWWGSVVAHPLAQGMKKATGRASFRLNWIKSPGHPFSPFLNSVSLCFGFTVRLSPHGKPLQLQAYSPCSGSHSGRGGLSSQVPPEVVGWTHQMATQNWACSGGMVGVSQGCPATEFISSPMLYK